MEESENREMRALARGVEWAICSIVALLGAFFWVVAQPNHNVAEAAYLIFVPSVILAARGVRLLPFLVAHGFAWWGAWVAVLIWLRHVTWFGTIGLAAFMAVFTVAWLLLVRAWLPALRKSSFLGRLPVFLALTGAWVVLEWLRGVLFTGFPWAPLALTQWQRPAILQVAAWTGAFGVGALLVLFQLCVGWTFFRRAFLPSRRSLVGFLAPDLYLALGLLIGSVMVFFKSIENRSESVPLFQAGFVQPYIAASLKWDEDEARRVLEILDRQTRFVSGLRPDVIFWPEAATPIPVVGNSGMRAWVERLVDEIDRPLLMGNLAEIGDPAGDAFRWYNAAFVVHPGEGLHDGFYAKQKLVPFGEYVPLRRVLFFIEKVVPVGDDFTPGTEPTLLPLRLADGRTWQAGPLICYEDIFPHLARSSVRAGADFLFVTTNNAWYGEEAGAYQHAAHSVLRAVETRRPVVRSGNGGWSGWIDAYGSTRMVLTNETGTIYFRGGGVAEVHQYRAWLGRESFYVRHGNWFVAVAALCFISVAVRKGWGGKLKR